MQGAKEKWNMQGHSGHSDEDWNNGHEQLISTGERFKLAFAERDKKQRMICRSHSPSNLDKRVLKPVMSLHKVFKTVFSVERWRSIIVCFSSLLAKCGLNLPPFGISGSWPPSLYIQLLTMPWGRILGRNPDKSLKSFPPCNAQSPIQLYLEISISWNSRNLLQFLQFNYCTL